MAIIRGSNLSKKRRLVPFTHLYVRVNVRSNFVFIKKLMSSHLFSMMKSLKLTQKTLEFKINMMIPTLMILIIKMINKSKIITNMIIIFPQNFLI